jgi:hypothetical protein
MFLPFLGITAVAIGLVNFGMLIIWLAVYKTLLGVTAAIAMLLGLGHIWRWHKDSRNGNNS